MVKKIKTFSNTEVEKHKFKQSKSTVLIHDVNIDRIIVINKFLFGKKNSEYFIRQEDDSEKILHLCTMIPEMSTYRRDFGVFFDKR